MTSNSLYSIKKYEISKPPQKKLSPYNKLLPKFKSIIKFKYKHTMHNNISKYYKSLIYERRLLPKYNSVARIEKKMFPNSSQVPHKKFHYIPKNINFPSQESKLN